MSNQEWITSFEALRWARRAGATTGGLAQWAEAGRLRSRADRGQFSDDEEGTVRSLKLPDTLQDGDPWIAATELIAEPWPDIPCEFWRWINAKPKQSEQHWDAGVFATTVYDDDAPNHHPYSQHIKLLDVTFHAGDLAGLLGAKVSIHTRATLPKNAKPNDHIYEEAAHCAAAIVRSKKVVLAEAFRRALREIEVPRKGSQESRERALRQCYDLMYDAEGQPVKKDQF